MDAFLTNIGLFFDFCITSLQSVLTVVTNSPALTVLVLAMPICGFAVGLLSRLIRL